MDRMQAREEALRRSKRKKMGRMGPPKPTRMGKIEERPMMTVGMMERLKERRRRQAIQAAGPGMLTGGQAKLDKNKNNKIDAQDFKILRAEKEAVKAAGGYSMGGMCRGMGAAIKGGKIGGVK